MSLVNTEEIMNIRLQVCKFQLQINMFYGQIDSLLAL